MEFDPFLSVLYQLQAGAQAGIAGALGPQGAGAHSIGPQVATEPQARSPKYAGLKKPQSSTGVVAQAKALKAPWTSLRTPLIGR